MNGITSTEFVNKVKEAIEECKKQELEYLGLPEVIRIATEFARQTSIVAVNAATCATTATSGGPKIRDRSELERDSIESLLQVAVINSGLKHL